MCGDRGIAARSQVSSGRQWTPDAPQTAIRSWTRLTRARATNGSGAWFSERQLAVGQVHRPCGNDFLESGSSEGSVMSEALQLR